VCKRLVVWGIKGVIMTPTTFEHVKQVEYFAWAKVAVDHCDMRWDGVLIHGREETRPECIGSERATRSRVQICKLMVGEHRWTLFGFVVVWQINRSTSNWVSHLSLRIVLKVKFGKVSIRMLTVFWLLGISKARASLMCEMSPPSPTQHYNDIMMSKRCQQSTFTSKIPQ
jgi:hypothetical protein